MKEKLTLQNARIKRNSILAELESDEHYALVQTMAYGDHNPFKIPLPACDCCGNTPYITRPREAPTRWFIYCDCGQRIDQSLSHEWKARIEWLMANFSGITLQKFPLFGIQKMPLIEARERMKGIRRNLELRVALADAQTVIAAADSTATPPGPLYRKRLDAYLKWSMLALRIIKSELVAQGVLTKEGKYVQERRNSA